jgi:hypothetical protein
MTLEFLILQLEFEYYYNLCNTQTPLRKILGGTKKDIDIFDKDWWREVERGCLCDIVERNDTVKQSYATILKIKDNDEV